MRAFRASTQRRFCAASATCQVPSSVVSLADVTVDIGSPSRVLVNGLTLNIGEGQRWVVLGANGCGKSATMKLLGRHLSADGGVPPANLRLARTAAYVSFESHRQLLHDELKQFNESRFTVCHKRATVSSYLFPELYPADLEYPHGYTGYRPPRTPLSPIPVPYDAGSSHPSLKDLEAAASSGQAEWLLRTLRLFDLRHQPICGLSTGEGRKLMLVDSLLSPPRLLVLDEAFDGLDTCSRDRLHEVLRTVLATKAWSRSAMALVTHKKEDCDGILPTHALVLGRGPDGTSYHAGSWDVMQELVHDYFESQKVYETSSPWLRTSERSAVSSEHVQRFSGSAGAQVMTISDDTSSEVQRDILVELRRVSIRYPTSVVFNPPLSWIVHEGQKWVVAGGNGSGKSTLLEIISGENMKAYQEDVRLFGRKKGSGESIWEIKQQLGVLSTEFHMKYVDFADPSRRSFADKPSVLTSWDVICSGFFDSVGLYNSIGSDQEQIARRWIDFFDIDDLVSIPQPNEKRSARKRRYKDFYCLSHGQQKLVLLCRAMVKQPRLLLLDEPTHGLSGHNRDRLLAALRTLSRNPDVAVIYVTHRLDEIDALDFDNLLHLGERSHHNTLDLGEEIENREQRVSEPCNM
eukprot:TRINITY_DN59126_c0_g1_i1.p1 TRINITY_DN59126_c0_g1~~TRINITY_DN59126_c0_g1_i1.p1  ORF type:complete len:633 (+),score=65.85 TRINITY_DN59126_c0_g1_i1:75-1973(+)